MRTTITINDTLYKSLRIEAARHGNSVSSLIENAVTQQLLEDTEDNEDASAREQEAILSFDELVAEFTAEGLL